MSVTSISRCEGLVADAIQPSEQTMARTPLTYGVLRRVLVDSGSMDERDARKLDRAMRRMLDE